MNRCATYVHCARCSLPLIREFDKPKQNELHFKYTYATSIGHALKAQSIAVATVIARF